MIKIIVPILGSIFLTGCATTESYATKSDMVASWYKDGSRTANGERFNPHGMTAAHKTLPFGTKLRLTHGERTAIVRINDRGPFIKGRHIDLSMGAAKVLGCSGICKIRVEHLK